MNFFVIINIRQFISKVKYCLKIYLYSYAKSLMPEIFFPVVKWLMLLRFYLCYWKIDVKIICFHLFNNVLPNGESQIDSSEIVWVINLLQAKRQITHNLSQTQNYSFVFHDNILQKEYERHLSLNGGASILIFDGIIQYTRAVHFTHIIDLSLLQ